MTPYARLLDGGSGGGGGGSSSSSSSGGSRRPAVPARLLSVILLTGVVVGGTAVALLTETGARWTAGSGVFQPLRSRAAAQLAAAAAAGASPSPPRGGDGARPHPAPPTPDPPVEPPSAPPRGPRGERYCDAPGGRCVLDAGFHSGQDTRQYLAAGYRVVAVEANPRLVAAGRAAFAAAIANGSLVLLGTGLISHELPRGTRLPFYRSTENDVWSSFVPEWGCRHADGSPATVADMEHCKAVAVPTTTCDALIRDYGTPYMLKVDIEGQDTHCISSLRRLHHSERPPYASVENVTPDHIRLFEGLGYFRFKAVDQGVLHTAAAAHAPELLGHSGPFGAAAPDALTGTHWQPASTLQARLPLPGVNAATGDAAWYDLHAALSRRQVRAYLDRRARRLGGAPAEPPLEHDGAVGPAAPAPGDTPSGQDAPAAAAAAATDEAADGQDQDTDDEEAGDVQPSEAPPLSLASAPAGASDGRRAQGGAAPADAAALVGPPPAPRHADAAAGGPPAVDTADDAATPDAGGDGSAVSTPTPDGGDRPRGGGGRPPPAAAAKHTDAVAPPPPSPPLPVADGAPTGTPPPAAAATASAAATVAADARPAAAPTGEAAAATTTTTTVVAAAATATAAAAATVADDPPPSPAPVADGVATGTAPRAGVVSAPAR